MTKLASMGAHSCGTFAINGFNSEFENEEYLEDKAAYRKKKGSAYNVVENFYRKVLYPVSQPHEETESYAFDYLMDGIEEHEYMNTKFIIAVLNPYMNRDNYYFKKRLLERGFTLLDRSENATMSGDIQYIYVRNLGRPED